jgi:hypothetical protein
MVGFSSSLHHYNAIKLGTRRHTLYTIKLLSLHRSSVIIIIIIVVE